MVAEVPAVRRRPALLLFICVATLLAAGLWLPLRAMLVRDWPAGWSGRESHVSVPVFPEPARITADCSCAGKSQGSGASEPEAATMVVPAETGSRSREAVARL